MSTDTHKPDVLTMALFGAAAAHAVLILGVSFTPFKGAAYTPPPLEVILTQPQNTPDEKNDEADYLSQSSQEGGGNIDEKAAPATMFASDQDFNTDGIAPLPVVKSAPSPAAEATDDVITAVFSNDLVKTEDSQVDSSESDAPEGTILIERDLEIARLSAQIDKRQEEFAKRPKRKWIRASTTEAASAEYMYRWVEKVERIGNLNFPDAARRNKLTGALILVVGIYKTGEIESIQVEESSGHKVLDDAAKRTVELSAPFDPLTGALADETDILYIVRTWEFKSNNSIISY